ncbi:MAG TPA: hypothetical protein ENK31_02395 [Nannocystis exedens]|nr:hypothetical protein [Nannocystis exedens]
MINARISLHAARNPEIMELARAPGEGNAAWIIRALGQMNSEARILLVGGTTVADFRLRVAQSHLRHDLKPSFWSHAALVLPGPSQPRLWQVDLEVGMPISEVPGNNGISEIGLGHFDSARFANLAVLRFPGASALAVQEGIDALRGARLSEDLLSPLIQWLAHVWGTDGAKNPLLAGIPLPAAHFVDAAFAYAGVDIVPGVSSRAACPEAVWQAALWWSGYYAGDQEGQAGAVPSGVYLVEQGSAHVVD